MSRYKIFWQYLLPQHLLSRLIGRLANGRWSWLKNAMIRWFIKHYHVDMSIAEVPDPSRYDTFNQFFTRALKAEARPIVTGDTIACPADGFISQVGMIKDNRIFQAKGFSFDLVELLGGSSEQAKSFQNGNFATIYLSPKDYHRVHMPMDGALQEMVYVPGKLFSVNRDSVAHIPNLFARNERVVSLFNTPIGEMALILVGAMIVASIETIWSGLVNPSKTIQTWQFSDENIVLKKGEEMGRFQLGSTVIVLFAPGVMQWRDDIRPDQAVLMGQQLGTFHYL